MLLKRLFLMPKMQEYLVIKVQMVLLTLMPKMLHLLGVVVVVVVVVLEALGLLQDQVMADQEQMLILLGLPL
jgi:hypothetical protein